MGYHEAASECVHTNHAIEFIASDVLEIASVQGVDECAQRCFEGSYHSDHGTDDDFDPQCYLERYPDLFERFGTATAEAHASATVHWDTCGKSGQPNIACAGIFAQVYAAGHAMWQLDNYQRIGGCIGIKGGCASWTYFTEDTTMLSEICSYPASFQQCQQADANAVLNGLFGSDAPTATFFAVDSSLLQDEHYRAPQLGCSIFVELEAKRATMHWSAMATRVDTGMFEVTAEDQCYLNYCNKARLWDVQNAYCLNEGSTSTSNVHCRNSACCTHFHAQKCKAHYHHVLDTEPARFDAADHECVAALGNTATTTLHSKSTPYCPPNDIFTASAGDCALFTRMGAKRFHPGAHSGDHRCDVVDLGRTPGCVLNSTASYATSTECGSAAVSLGTNTYKFKPAGFGSGTVCELWQCNPTDGYKQAPLHGSTYVNPLQQTNLQYSWGIYGMGHHVVYKAPQLNDLHPMATTSVDATGMECVGSGWHSGSIEQCIRICYEDPFSTVKLLIPVTGANAATVTIIGAQVPVTTDGKFLKFLKQLTTRQCTTMVVNINKLAKLQKL